MGIIRFGLGLLYFLSAASALGVYLESLPKGRVKVRVRDFDVSFMQHVQRVGYERGIPLSGKGSYADGTNCFTGQEPWNGFEAAEAQKLFRVHFYYLHGLDIPAIHCFDRYEDYSQAFNRTLGMNCLSKTCYFDLTRYIALCGKPSPPKPLYLDGRSCLDGTPRRSISWWILENWGYRGAYGFPDDTDWVESQNQKAQERYGRNCKSGKCNYMLDGDYICGGAVTREQHGMQLELVAVLIFSHLGLPLLRFESTRTRS